MIELSNEQLKNLAVMFCYVESLYQNKIIDNYNSFLKKIKKFIPDKQVQLLNKEIKKQREKVETDFFKHAPFEELIKKIENYRKSSGMIKVQVGNLWYWNLAPDADSKQIKKIGW